MASANLPVTSPHILQQARHAVIEAVVQTLLVIGSPRSGKFWGTRPLLWNWFESREGGALLLFPQANENAQIALQDAQQRLPKSRIWFDSIDNPLFVLALLCVARPTNPDPYLRSIETILIRDALLELLGRGRKEPIEQQPLIIELATKAVELWLAATIPVTLAHLLAVGKHRHPLFVELLDNCPDPDLIWFWTTMPNEGAAVRRELAALWRLLDQKFGHPQLLTRSTEEELLRKLLEDGHVVIVEGSQSSRATSIYMGLLNMMALQIIRNSFTRTGKPLKTLILADEINGYSLFGPYERKAIQQVPKAGLHYIGISHTPRLTTDPDDNSDILQSLHAVHAYRCGDWATALDIAQCVAGPALDPYLVHHRDVRTLQRNDGFDIIPTTTITKTTGQSGDRTTETKGVSDGERFVARYREDTEETDHYMNYRDQFSTVASRLMQIDGGQRLARTFGRVCWEQVPKLEEPWIIPELGTAKLTAMLREMYQRPEYRKPSLPTPVAMPSLRTSGSTRQPSNNSSNGHNGHSTQPSLSAATKALLAVLRRTGRNPDAP